MKIPCSKFHTCNAALCPLMRDWQEHRHLPGEATCKYLLDSEKHGAADRYANDPAFTAVLEIKPAVCGKHHDIARAVEVASRSGFRGDNLRPKSGSKGPKTHVDTRVTAPKPVLSRSDAATTAGPRQIEPSSLPAALSPVILAFATKAASRRGGRR